MELLDHTCCALVYPVGEAYARSRRCGAKAKIIRDGKPYCKRHDPVDIAEKKKVRDVEFEKQMEAKRAKWALERAAPKMLAALKGARKAVHMIAGADEDWLRLLAECDEAIAIAEGGK